MGSGYNTKDKIQKQYIGLLEEYGLTDRITIGSDIMFATQWSTRNGKITGRIQDKSFALQYINVFGRWNFYRSDDEKVRLNLYMSVNTPSFGKGTGSSRTQRFAVAFYWRICLGGVAHRSGKESFKPITNYKRLQNNPCRLQQQGGGDDASSQGCLFVVPKSS